MLSEGLAGPVALSLLDKELQAVTCCRQPGWARLCWAPSSHHLRARLGKPLLWLTPGTFQTSHPSSALTLAEPALPFPVLEGICRLHMYRKKRDVFM